MEYSIKHYFFHIINEIFINGSSSGMPILAHNEKLLFLKTSDNALWKRYYLLK